MLHEVKKRHITQVQAGKELGVTARWVRELLRRMKFYSRSLFLADCVGDALVLLACHPVGGQRLAHAEEDE